MTTVFATMSMSIDGFIAGPNDNLRQPMGEGGQRLHEWMFNHPDAIDVTVAGEFAARSGAVMVGRSMFDLAQDDWGDENPFGLPTYVVTHRPHEPVIKGNGPPYEFASNGLQDAIRQAKATAKDKDVWVPGGANLIQQLIGSGLLDELRMTLVPLILGRGRCLFDGVADTPVDLKVTNVIASPNVTHLTYTLAK